MFRLKELRIERHISQKELADALGLGYSSLSQYENGLRQPSYETLVRIADYFGVSTDYLLGRTHTGPSIAPEEMKLLELFRAFNREGKERALDFLNAMKRSGLYEEGTDYFLKGFIEEDREAHRWG